MVGVVAATLILTVVWLLVRRPDPVYADLKCGDAPTPFGEEGLVVTWVGPVPRWARVTVKNGDSFRSLARMTGFSIPSDLPKKYLSDLHEVEVFNASQAWDIDGVIEWQERHGIKMETKPLSVFKRYLETDHAIFLSLVEHPWVIDPGRYVACSLILQWGVIFYATGRETLFLKSYFHSAPPNGKGAVNFVPVGGVKMSFATESLWYPNELSPLIPEPASYIVLDILTPERFDAKLLPDAFQVQERGRVRFGVEKYDMARVTATVESGRAAPDLLIKV